MDFSEFGLLASADVVVCGGGTAGAAAATAAARSGASVVLLEKGGCCGGLGTRGLVPMVFVGYDANRHEMPHFFDEVLAKYIERTGEEITSYWQSMQAEHLKKIYDDMLCAAGVELFYDVNVAAAEVSGGRIVSVLAATVTGLKRVEGKVFIDASGDGAVGAFAGAGFSVGDQQGRVMGPTCCVEYAGVDHAAVRASAEPDCAIWRKLYAAGEAPENEPSFVGMRLFGNTMSGGNVGHAYGCNPLDAKSLSLGYIEGRRLAWSYLDFYRRSVPGYSRAELAATAELLGVRESRRLKCDYTLSLDDYCRRAGFPDEIGRFSYRIDIHSSGSCDAEQAELRAFIAAHPYRPGDSYGVPYRSLCVKSLDNLLAAGRCCGCDRPVMSSLRVMSGCMLTGQAAGLAAAMAAASSKGIRDINVAELQRQMADF